MNLHIAKPYLNLTDFRKCKFCWYFKQAKHLPEFGGCKLRESMVRAGDYCNQWMDPTGEIKVDEKAFEAPKNKIIR